jgi:tRNA-dihydrouridine synthase A
MVPAGALIHGDIDRYLKFNACASPVALQLGGSDPKELAVCASLAERYGFSEVNLNCGCPSERVQRGSFGACLMNESELVADCVKSMLDVVAIPVTVKHRIGLDKVENYDFVRDFVGKVSEAGCKTFIVHARNAWLQGLSPKDNRTVPALRYDFVYRLKLDFPNLIFVINGGINSSEQIAHHLTFVDGVMAGREAYHNPWWLSEWDVFFNDDDLKGLATSAPVPKTRESVELKMVEYMTREHEVSGVSWQHIARHMLGLRHGLPDSRHWRQVWSDHRLRDMSPDKVMALAHRA